MPPKPVQGKKLDSQAKKANVRDTSVSPSDYDSVDTEEDPSHESRLSPSTSRRGSSIGPRASQQQRLGTHTQPGLPGNPRSENGTRTEKRRSRRLVARGAVAESSPANIPIPIGPARRLGIVPLSVPRAPRRPQLIVRGPASDEDEVAFNNRLLNENNDDIDWQIFPLYRVSSDASSSPLSDPPSSSPSTWETPVAALEKSRYTVARRPPSFYERIRKEERRAEAALFEDRLRRKEEQETAQTEGWIDSAGLEEETLPSMGSTATSSRSEAEMPNPPERKSFAKKGKEDESKLSVTVRRGGKAPRTFTYSHKIDWNNSKDVQDLNKWRSQHFRRAYGLVRAAADHFVQQERNFLIEAHKKLSSGESMNWSTVTQAFNKKFAGKLLRDSIQRRPERTAASLRGERDRIPEIMNTRERNAQPEEEKRRQRKKKKAVEKWEVVHSEENESEDRTTMKPMRRGDRRPPMKKRLKSDEGDNDGGEGGKGGPLHPAAGAENNLLVINK